MRPCFCAHAPCTKTSESPGALDSGVGVGMWDYENAIPEGSQTLVGMFPSRAQVNPNPKPCGTPYTTANCRSCRCWCVLPLKKPTRLHGMLCSLQPPLQTSLDSPKCCSVVPLAFSGLPDVTGRRGACWTTAIADRASAVTSTGSVGVGKDGMILDELPPMVTESDRVFGWDLNRGRWELG